MKYTAINVKYSNVTHGKEEKLIKTKDAPGDDIIEKDTL